MKIIIIMFTMITGFFTVDSIKNDEVDFGFGHGMYGGMFGNDGDHENYFELHNYLRELYYDFDFDEMTDSEKDEAMLEFVELAKMKSDELGLEFSDEYLEMYGFMGEYGFGGMMSYSEEDSELYLELMEYSKTLHAEYDWDNMDDEAKLASLEEYQSLLSDKADELGIDLYGHNYGMMGRGFGSRSSYSNNGSFGSCH